MKSFLHGNRLPRSYTYHDVEEVLCLVENPMQLGRNTTATFYMPSQPHGRHERVICVRLHGHPIVSLYDNETVYLHSRGMKNKVTKARMDAALQGIGYRLVAVNRKWKIYEIATGTYIDYFDGIMVAK